MVAWLALALALLLVAPSPQPVVPSGPAAWAFAALFLGCFLALLPRRRARRAG